MIADIVKDMEGKGAEADVDIVKEADAGKDIVSLEAEGEDAPVIKIVEVKPLVHKERRIVTRKRQYLARSSGWKSRTMKE